MEEARGLEKERKKTKPAKATQEDRQGGKLAEKGGRGPITNPSTGCAKTHTRQEIESSATKNSWESESDNRNSLEGREVIERGGKSFQQD